MMYRKLVYLIVFVLVFELAGRASAALIAQWTLDEGSGTIATDVTGNGHDGTLEGDPQWVAGYFGGALQFAGSPDRVVVPYSPELNPEDAFTVSVWANVEPGSTGYRSPITSRDDAPQRGYIIYASSGDTWQFWIGNGSGWTNAAGPAVEFGEWTHVAGTYAPGDMKLYIDGVQAAEAAGTISLNTQQYLSIGAGRTDTPAGDYFYVGMVDDVRLYDQVLTEEQIAASMLNQGAAIVKAYSPDPPDGALYEDTWVNLSWQPGDLAASHDVYLGESFDDVNNATPDSDVFRGNQTDTFFVAGFPGFPYPDGLVPGTTYYWRIDEVNDADPNSPWKGDVWSFTVPPKKAYDPNPGDAADYIDTNVQLSWTAGFGAKLHTVYFGTSFDDVNSAAGGLPATETTYNPGSLEKDMTYYWRVDEFDGVVTYKGNVWSFSTVPAIAITDPTLMGWWKLDEGAGNVAVDWSGHDNHGTIVGMPQWIAGYDGDGLELDGTNWVDCGSDDSLAITGPLTITCWVNPGSLTGDRGFAARTGAYAFKSYGTNLRFTTPGIRDHDAANAILEMGVWQHVAATFDPNQAGGMAFYINGVEMDRLDAARY
ncbi:MAG: LamG domain-containing protein [Sedimentisphaerales bacterium]